MPDYDVEQREATNRVRAGVEVKVFLPLTCEIFSCCSTVTDKNQWKSSNLYTRRQENDMIELHEDKFNCILPALVCVRMAGTRLKDQRGQRRGACCDENVADQPLAPPILWFLFCLTQKSNCGCPKRRTQRH